MRKWTAILIQQEAFKYKTRNEFIKHSGSAYNAARRMGILDDVCSHMPKHVDQSGENHGRFKWTPEKIAEEALKYGSKSAFAKNSAGAHEAAVKIGILDEICAHMPRRISQSGTNSPRFKWTLEMLQQEALKYKARGEFRSGSGGAYSTAKRRGVLGKICKHMQKSGDISSYESDLFSLIKDRYPKAIVLKIRKKNLILDRPHISGFDIDIYIPELRKGIEFDGRYWHSMPGLKRSREHWPEEDIRNYHKIKDEYFKSKGIEILHIDENDWRENKNKCLEKALHFLSNHDTISK